MGFLDFVLPVLLYLVAIILLTVLTVLGVRLIAILNKVDKIVDNIDEKVNTFNGAFNVLGKAANGFASITDSLMFNVSTIVSKLFNNKRKNEEESDYE